MTEVNPEGYALAQQKIAEGAWRVDPLRGLIYGCFGRPIGSVKASGYAELVIYVPPGWPTRLHLVAHRVVWESVNGPLPVGLFINHLNGKKADNRIANLEAVTATENMQHAIKSGLARFPGMQLTRSQALAIYQRARAGETGATLAAEYGVSRDCVRLIRNGHRWASVTGHWPNGQPPQPRLPKQVCVNGHRLEGDNIRFTDKGKRVCIPCAAERSRRSYLRHHSTAGVG